MLSYAYISGTNDVVMWLYIMMLLVLLDTKNCIYIVVCYNHVVIIRLR